MIQRSDMNEWWRSAVIYQVYPRSFSDSNSDGVGDLPGVISRLDYLADLGVNALWLSPFYPSPQIDAGYDVADYFSINPEYGTLDDARELVEQAHERGMKIIIDIVPNHSSDQHEWFKSALAATPDSPERARYIFRYSPDGPPNNWGSMFGGSAWQPVFPLTHKPEDDGWWYLHLFAPEQPDFDWTNSDVHQMFIDYLRFWCDLGVDGFRVDVAHGLVKEAGLPDDAIGPDRWAPHITEEQKMGPSPFFDQDGVHDIYDEWRKVLDEYGRDRMLVAEAWVTPPTRGALYVRENEMSQAFNFDYLKCGWYPEKLRFVINQTVREMGNVGAPVTWVLSNHDVVRHTTRFGYEPGHNTEEGIGVTDPQPDRELGLQRGLAMSLFTFGLPGSVYMYQGEELGLPEVTDLPDESRQDPTWFRTDKRVRGRDGCRVPLPWDSNLHDTGFGEHPWLPQPDYWADLSVTQQELDSRSPLNFYREMIRIRREYDLGNGTFEWGEHPDSNVVVVKNSTVTLVLNMADYSATVPGEKAVLMASGPVDVTPEGIELPGNTVAWLI